MQCIGFGDISTWDNQSQRGIDTFACMNVSAIFSFICYWLLFILKVLKTFLRRKLASFLRNVSKFFMKAIRLWISRLNSTFICYFFLIFLLIFIDHLTSKSHKFSINNIFKLFSQKKSQFFIDIFIPFWRKCFQAFPLERKENHAKK